MMASLSLSSRDLRAVVIGLGVITTAWVATRGVPLWEQWRDDAQGHAADAQRRYLAEHEAITDLPGDLTLLETRLSQLQEYKSTLLLGSDLTGAEQVLADLVGEASRLASISLETLQVLTDTSGTAAIRVVTLEARGASDVTGLTMLLEYLENGPQLLVVQRLAVQAHDPWSPDALPESLTISFTVQGLALIDHSRKSDTQ